MTPHQRPRCFVRIVEGRRSLIGRDVKTGRIGLPSLRSNTALREGDVWWVEVVSTHPKYFIFLPIERKEE